MNVNALKIIIIKQRKFNRLHQFKKDFNYITVNSYTNSQFDRVICSPPPPKQHVEQHNIDFNDAQSVFFFVPDRCIAFIYIWRPRDSPISREVRQSQRVCSQAWLNMFWTSSYKWSHNTHTHTSSPHPSLPLAILFSPHDDRIKHKCRAREPSDAMMLNRHDQRTRKSAHSRACLINDIRGRREERSPAARCGGGLHQAQQQQQQRVGGWVSFVLPLTEPNILEMYIRNKDSDIEYDDDDDASERFVFFARLAQFTFRFACVILWVR